MLKQKYTTVTQLHKTNNKDLIEYFEVNPAWTSWIAKNKFCNRMKLNIHIGASFVIARRGIGIEDKVK